MNNLFDVIESLELSQQKLYYGSPAYEAVLKVCRNKIAMLAEELGAVVDIVKIMSVQPEFLSNDNPAEIKEEISKRADLFYEAEI